MAVGAKIALPSRYKSTGTAFKGGFGEVAVLHDTFLDRAVVLKRLSDPADLAQLLAEIHAISSLQSRHVVQILDVLYDSAGIPIAIIEEFLPNSDLTSYWKEAPYDKDRYLRTIYQLSKGIADIHASDLVHRDIKLNNVKRDQENLIKIFDFGLSCVHEKHETLSGRGTLIFAAPELYFTPLKISQSLDVYAFGICCWFLLTNSLPAQLLEMPPQTSGHAPSLSSVATGVGNELINILDATLDPDPAARPEMGAVSALIEQHLLYGRHRAWFTGGRIIDKPGQAGTLAVAGIGKIVIRYDGLAFIVVELEGEVYINNKVPDIGQHVPTSSVITLGAQSRGAYRTFVEFYMSNPEVVL